MAKILYLIILCVVAPLECIAQDLVFQNDVMIKGVLGAFMPHRTKGTLEGFYVTIQGPRGHEAILPCYVKENYIHLLRQLCRQGNVFLEVSGCLRYIRHNSEDPLRLVIVAKTIKWKFYHRKRKPLVH